MLRRKSVQEKKTPVKGEPVKKEKPLIETICTECGKKRPYSNKTKKLCAVCVKKSQKEKLRVKKENAGSI